MIQKINTLEEYQIEYQKSVENPEKFWEEKAKTFHWTKPFSKVLNWEFETPKVTWFEDGETNITLNCIDRHLPKRANQVAFHWEANQISGAHQSITYQQLHDEVCRVANALKELGITKGDRVCIYLPMIPELLYTVLACARIGAIHSVVFAGFSAKALKDRIDDAEAKLVVTSTVSFRGEKINQLEQIVDEAVHQNEFVEHVLVVNNFEGADVANNSIKVDWKDLVSKQNNTCIATPIKSEDELFILYTSGSTGKPKGVVHTVGGYMVYAEYSFRNVFQYEDNDVYWCTADIGWITGHTYITYGPLLAGATSVMFEGVPTYPDAGRFWQVCEKYKVNQFYTAPTAIRALMVHGVELVNRHNLTSLKVLGTVGEPINEEAWHWYNEVIGKENCPIVDTWWQTETGGIMIAPLAGITATIPTFATKPLPGIQPCLMDSEGNEIDSIEAEGSLCIKFPWPSMIRTTWGDHQRCKEVYSAYPNNYFTGDGCKRDANGNYRITGRIDDVINVSGHRIGTAEVEDAINTHPNIVESAVVGYPHEIKGEGIFTYVICNDSNVATDELHQELNQVVVKEIGPIAKPDRVLIVTGLPKTRSGKIMRRILRKLASNQFESLGDISTLLDPSVVDEIKTKL